MISQTTANTLFTYNPITGDLLNKVTRSSNAKAGDLAGGLDGKGYRFTFVEGKIYMVTSLIWLLQTGSYPAKGGVDHIDGNGLNNAWRNLRLATKSQQAWNTRIPKNNISGIKGICLCLHKGVPTIRASVDCYGKSYTRTRQYTPTNKKQLLYELSIWLIAKRKELHKEFTNNGDLL